MNPSSVWLVWCNAPDENTADALARRLVETGLAACVSRGPAGVSTFRWQGDIETRREVPLLIKTTADRYPALEAAILAQHPDSVPEVLATPIIAGLSAYLTWVAEETRS
jgi:periplasmic divalent cation tolerance protein